MEQLYYVYCDPQYREDIEERIRSVLPVSLAGVDSIEQRQVRYPKGAHVFVYASDEQLREILPWLVKKDIILCILPHPASTMLYGRLGIQEKTTENLVQEIVHTTQERRRTLPWLYCNNEFVYSGVYVGENLELLEAPLGHWWQELWYRWRVLHRIRPVPVEVSIEDTAPFVTAIVGGMLVPFYQGKWWQRLLPKDSHYAEGKLHGFLFMPRSVTGLLYFFVQSYIRARSMKYYGGYMRSSLCMLRFPSGFLEYQYNGKEYQTKEIRCEMKETIARWYVGEELCREQRVGDIYRVQQLPLHGTIQELVGKALPFWRHASTEDFKDLFQLLREHAVVTSSFIVLMVLASLLATIGLLADSSPVLIGAMLLAPLMNPIVSLSMAVLRQDKVMALQSAMTIGLGVSIVLAVAIGIALVFPIALPTTEIMLRTRPNLLDLAVAIVSGVAGAYGYAREEVAKSLVGVSIAVALVIPLAVVGIGIAWGELGITSGAFLLFITNFTGIVLAAALTFFFLGFSPLRPVIRGIIWSLVFVFVLLIPLGVGFWQIQKEAYVVDQLEGIEVEGITIREVRVYDLDPVHIGMRAVAEAPLTSWDMDLLEEYVADMLKEETVRLEVSTALLRK